LISGRLQHVNSRNILLNNAVVETVICQFSVEIVGICLQVEMSVSAKIEQDGTLFSGLLAAFASLTT
jgi:hypothetical protein